jgi:DNA-binding NarL/FixJ family response regulator
MEQLNVLLVDDNQNFLDAAVRFLLTDSRIKIAGLVRSAYEAIDQVRQLQPDLVLMDVSMPGLNGWEVTALIKALPQAPSVVIVSFYDYPEYYATARVVQADGFISKNDFGTQLFTLIESLFDLPQSFSF